MTVNTNMTSWKVEKTEKFIYSADKNFDIHNDDTRERESERQAETKSKARNRIRDGCAMLSSNLNNKKFH